MLSKCIFGISFTINNTERNTLTQLWIAFKMYLWHIVYNFGRLINRKRTVVNCFQNVSLAYRLQWLFFRMSVDCCCELLSKCIFGISFTILFQFSVRSFWLWIAFKMYLWHIVYNRRCITARLFLVVNCFQNVSLAYRLQYIANLT